MNVDNITAFVENNSSINELLNISTSDIKYSLASLVPQWSKNVLIIYMVGVFLIGLPGNLLVIIVQKKTVNKSATDWFVFYLAICDILSLVICLPTFSLICAELWQHVGTSAWCKFHMFTLQLAYQTSTLLILMLNTDRYNKTVSTNHRLKFTATKAFYAGLVTFVLTSLWSAPTLITTKNNVLGQCIYDPKWMTCQLYLHLSGYMVTLIICILSAVIYARIYLSVKRYAQPEPSIKHLSETNCGIILNIAADDKNAPKQNVKYKMRLTAKDKDNSLRDTDCPKGANTSPRPSVNRICHLTAKKELRKIMKESSYAQWKKTTPWENDPSTDSSNVPRNGNGFPYEMSEGHTDCYSGQSVSYSKSRHSDHDDGYATLKYESVDDGRIQINYGSPVRQAVNPTCSFKSYMTRKRAVITTKVMGFVTLIFICSACIPSLAGLFLGAFDMQKHEHGRIAIFFITRLYMINNCANPLFYIWLYPSFRYRAWLLFKW